METTGAPGASWQDEGLQVRRGRAALWSHCPVLFSCLEQEVVIKEGKRLASSF